MNAVIHVFPSLKALFDPRKISECYKKLILVMPGLRLDIFSLDCASAKSFKQRTELLE